MMIYPIQSNPIQSNPIQSNPIQSFVVKFSLALFLSLWFGLVQAGIPQTISYQGYLTDAAGEPVEGDVAVTFSILDTSWTETHIVKVVNGVFSQLLGVSNSFEGKVDFSQPYQLKVEPIVDQIKLDIPPTPFSSVPYAFYADRAEEVDEPTLGKLQCSDGQVPAWNAVSGEWFCSDNIPGPKGDKGDKGDRGPKGDTGSSFSGSRITIGGRCFEPRILKKCYHKVDDKRNIYENKTWFEFTGCHGTLKRMYILAECD